MKDFQLWALQNAGGSTSVRQVEMNDEGQLKVDAELTAGSVSVTGSISSVVATGPVVADTADDGSAPVQAGLIARTANPTAVAGGDVVKQSADDLGRALTRPIQARDLLATAYATVTNITETVLLAGAAGVFHDLIFVKFSNQSGAAVNVELRSSTGGTVVDTFSVPANSTVGYAPPVPIPQSVGEAQAAWTFKNAASDDSTTTIAASGLFSKEV